MPIMNVPVLGPNTPQRGNWFSRAVGRGVLSILGWRIVGPVPDLAKMVVILAPHTSNWDGIIGLAAVLALGIRISWMGKDSLFRWPFGGFLRWLGGVAIDRKAQHGVVAQMVDEFQRREQFALAVAPEGTRKKVAQWKTGFYHIARGAGAPILLAYWDYGAKSFGIGPILTPSGDLEADMATIRAFYAAKTPKHPDRV